MIRTLRTKLSYANVMATIAVFIALGGSSYAAIKVSGAQIVNNSVRSKDLRNNDVRGKDVRNNSLSGADINESRLGSVPSADRAGSADTAGSAARAENADALGGISASGYVQAPTEAVRLVGTPDNPAFGTGWANFGLGAAAGFFKDQFGVVHLQGDLNPPNSASTIFTLPPGYRPTQNGAAGPQFIVRADGGAGVVDVDSDGDVSALESYANHLSLNGITFRAVD